GGDAVIEGTVLGDVVTMGGDLDIRDGGEVRGEIVTFGGEVDAADHDDTPAIPAIPFVGQSSIDRFGELMSDAFSSFVAYALLFVLGLLMTGLARDRFDALRVAIVK